MPSEVHGSRRAVEACGHRGRYLRACLCPAFGVNWQRYESRGRVLCFRFLFVVFFVLLCFAVLVSESPYVQALMLSLVWLWVLLWILRGRFLCYRSLKTSQGTLYCEPQKQTEKERQK